MLATRQPSKKRALRRAVGFGGGRDMGWGLNSEDLRGFEQTLAYLAQSFMVQSIMVPKERLVCGRDRESAQLLLEQHPDLDVIPIERQGKLTAYLMRGSKKPKDIRIQDMIGAG